MQITLYVLWVLKDSSESNVLYLSDISDMSCLPVPFLLIQDSNKVNIDLLSALNILLLCRRSFFTKTFKLENWSTWSEIREKTGYISSSIPALSIHNFTKILIAHYPSAADNFPLTHSYPIYPFPTHTQAVQQVP
jgi:hypothetical protein